MQAQVIFGASYSRSRCFRWPEESLVLHPLLAPWLRDIRPEQSRSQMCRASTRCHLRGSTWSGTLCQGAVSTHTCRKAGSWKGDLYVQWDHVHLRNMGSCGSSPWAAPGLGRTCLQETNPINEFDFISRGASEHICRRGRDCGWMRYLNYTASWPDLSKMSLSVRNISNACIKTQDMNAKTQRKYMHLYCRKRPATAYLLCAGITGSAYGLFLEISLTQRHVGSAQEQTSLYFPGHKVSDLIYVKNNPNLYRVWWWYR